MRILLINHYAGSPEMGMEFRPYYFAKQWVDAGHDVFILAADNSHLRKKKIKINKSFEKQDIDGIKYFWIKTPEYNGNGVSRVLNIFSFVFKSYLNSKRLVREINPDIVIASSTYPIDNYIARRIAKLSGAKHIYEVHDLWPLSPMELGKMSKYHPFIMIMQHGENFAYKHCDAVISMLPNTKEHMQNHGLDLKKWHYVPNGINPEEWENPSDIPDMHKSILENLKRENKTIIGYAGGHAISNALDTLIEAADILKENEKIYFMQTGKVYETEEVGILYMNRFRTGELSAGNVGYFTASIRDLHDTKVGDTV
ncbi:MAG: glycosyltransferase, partial [Bacteroidales bacterium]